MLKKEEIKKLIEVARQARENAFVHRSEHKIGAAVLTEDGEYFGGCNTESVISGLGVCAEVSAMDHAVVHGKYRFRALLVMDEKKTYPCGACLQYLSLFEQVSGKDVYVVVADVSGKTSVKKLSKLLPHRYKTESGLEEIRKY